MKSVDALLEQVNQHDQVVHQIDAALASHLATFRDAFFDLLAALITLLIFATSFVHAIKRKVVARSHTSPFREVRHE